MFVKIHSLWQQRGNRRITFISLISWWV